MSSMTQQIIDGLPEGSKHLSGNLFMVPFASIRSSARNPRLLTEKGQSDIMDKNLSMTLRECIKKNTLLNPLVCRWVQEGDKFFPMVVGGDRRHRALDFLIRHKEKVVDPRVPKFGSKGELASKIVPADEAYEFVPCQVFMCSNDLDALALAWAENRNRINLTEGHEIAEVIQLRQNDATDARIMEILQKDSKWLSDTDKLIASLDSSTLADLLENRLDRNSAIELAGISDEKLRNEVRIAAHDSATESAVKRIARLQKKIEKSEEIEEIAKGEIVLAKTEEDKQEAREKVDRARAERNAAQRKIDQEPTPTASTQDVREASRRIVGQVPTTRSKRGPKGGTRKMRESKIIEGRDFFSAILRNNGECPEGEFVANVDSLKLVLRFINHLVSNNPDWAGMLKEHYSV